MTKIEKRQLREENIIQIVIEYLQQNTVLELKMSHVAKLANCSMGAIYSHFPSKEDLILACAYRQIKKILHVLIRLLISNPTLSTR